MGKKIRARFSQGKIQPLETVDLEEGQLVTVTIGEEGVSPREAPEKAAGAWQGTIDFDAYLRDLMTSRRQSTRDVDL